VLIDTVLRENALASAATIYAETYQNAIPVSARRANRAMNIRSPDCGRLVRTKANSERLFGIRNSLFVTSRHTPHSVLPSLVLSNCLRVPRARSIFGRRTFGRGAADGR